MHKLIVGIARLFAVLGGTMLSALIVLTCLSIIGRGLNTFLHGDMAQTVFPGMANLVISIGTGPINGDFELVEAGMAFAIFAFMPLCQLMGAHASVDIFTSRLSPRLNSLLRMIIQIVFAVVFVLIAVQLMQGMMSKYRSGQTSFLLQYPIWWGYAASLSGAVAAALVAVYVAVAHTVEAISGRAVLPVNQEPKH